jgi:hypothetical protein
MSPSDDGVDGHIFLTSSSVYKIVSEDTIGNEIVTSDQPVNAMQGTFL